MLMMFIKKNKNYFCYFVLIYFGPTVGHLLVPLGLVTPLLATPITQHIPLGSTATTALSTAALQHSAGEVLILF